MRKFFVAIFLCFLPVVSFGWSSSKFYIGKWQECFIDRNGNDAYYFCSYADGKSCNDVKIGSNDKVHRVSSGTVLDETLLKAGNKNVKTEDIKWLNWVCCRVSSDGDHGHWKAPSTSKKTKEVNGGTCEQTVDQCGTLVQDCTEQDIKCGEGKKARTINGQNYCAPVCSSGMGYESANSNSCIECNTTMVQGVDKDGVCRKCDSATQFFRPPTDSEVGGCKSIEDASNKYSKNQFQQCWKCSMDSTEFKNCMIQPNPKKYAEENCKHMGGGGSTQ